MQTRTASQNDSMPIDSGVPSIGSDESRRSSLAEPTLKIGGQDNDSDRPAKRARLSREASNASDGPDSSNSQDLKIATRSQTALAEAELKAASDEPADDADHDGEANDADADDADINGSQEANGVADGAKPSPKKPWLGRRRRRRGFAGTKKPTDAGSSNEIPTPDLAEGIDGLDRQSPGKVEPGEILRRLPGRRRAPHADPSIEADLRRQLELKVAYRAVVKALKPVLVELAARTGKELDGDRELFKQYPEYEEVTQELNRRLEERLSVLNAWHREEEARIKRMKNAHEEIIYNQFAGKFQEMRENLVLECEHEFLSVVRQIEAKDDGDATDEEDGIIPRLYHHDMVSGARWSLDDRYDSRSRVFMETDRLWNDFEDRQQFHEEQKRHEPESLEPHPKGFAVYDGDLRRQAVALINLNLLANAGKEIGEHESRVARGELSNEAAVGLQALVQASDIATTKSEPVPATSVVVEKVEQSPSIGRGHKRARSPDKVDPPASPSPKKPALEPLPPKKNEEVVDAPLSFKPSERGERPFDLPIATSTDTRLPPDPSSSRQYDMTPARPASRGSYPPMYSATTDRPQLPPISMPPMSAPDYHDPRYPPRPSGEFPDLWYHHHHPHAGPGPPPLDPRHGPPDQPPPPPHGFPPLAPAPHLAYHHHPPPPPGGFPPPMPKDGLTSRVWEPGQAPRKRPGPRPHYSTHSPSSFGPPAGPPQYSPFANSMGPPMFAPQYVKDPSSRRSSGQGSAASSPVPKHEQPSTGGPSGRKSNELREIRAYVPHSEVGQPPGFPQTSPTSNLFPRHNHPPGPFYTPNNAYAPYPPPGPGQYDPVRPPSEAHGRGPPLSPRSNLLLQRGHSISMEMGSPNSRPPPPPPPGQHSSTPPGGYGYPPPPVTGSPRATPGSGQHMPPYHQHQSGPGPSPPPAGPPPSASAPSAPPPTQPLRSKRPPNQPPLPPQPPGSEPNLALSKRQPGQPISGHQPILPATMDPNRYRPPPPQPPPQTQIMRFPSYVSPSHSNQGSMSVFSAFTPPRRYDSRLDRGNLAPGRSRSPATRGAGSGRGRGGRRAKDATPTTTPTAVSPSSHLRNSQTPGEEPSTPLEHPEGQAAHEPTSLSHGHEPQSLGNSPAPTTEHAPEHYETGPAEDERYARPVPAPAPPGYDVSPTPQNNGRQPSPRREHVQYTTNSLDSSLPNEPAYAPAAPALPAPAPPPADPASVDEPRPAYPQPPADITMSDAPAEIPTAEAKAAPKAPEVMDETAKEAPPDTTEQATKPDEPASSNVI